MIAEGETVGDVLVFGGDLVIRGHVQGSAACFGGEVTLTPTAVVDKELLVFGGEVHSDPAAVVRGERIVSNGKHSEDSRDRAEHDDDEEETWLSRISSAFTQAALLFLLGLALIGFAPTRLKVLDGVLRRRPLASLFGGLVGATATCVLMVVFAITIIGIPVTVALALALPLMFYVGLAAVAIAIGDLLRVPFLEGKPLLRLLAGVALVGLVSLLPVVGGLIVGVLGLAGLGALLLTKWGAYAGGTMPPEAPLSAPSMGA